MKVTTMRGHETVMDKIGLRMALKAEISSLVLY